MTGKPETHRFLQIHIDAARNATDDFNPFHDPHKWDAIRENPFGAPIVLGFQLAALAESRVQACRQQAGELDLAVRHGLHFLNYQFSFADVVRPGEEIQLQVKPTANRIEASGQIANRIAIRKDKKLVMLGYQRESREPLVEPGADFSGLGDLRLQADRYVIENGRFFLKRKYMNTSNGKNFLAGSLVDQHLHFDELENRVRFPAMFPAAYLSCALLEKERMNGHDFYGHPMVYTSHMISVDRQLLTQLRSNDCLHILVEGPEQIEDEKGLGKAGIPQTAYTCFGLVDENKILYRARVFLALLSDVVAARRIEQ